MLKDTDAACNMCGASVGGGAPSLSAAPPPPPPPVVSAGSTLRQGRREWRPTLRCQGRRMAMAQRPADPTPAHPRPHRLLPGVVTAHPQPPPVRSGLAASPRPRSRPKPWDPWRRAAMGLAPGRPRPVVSVEHFQGTAEATPLHRRGRAPPWPASRWRARLIQAHRRFQRR